MDRMPILLRQRCCLGQWAPVILTEEDLSGILDMTPDGASTEIRISAMASLLVGRNPMAFQAPVTPEGRRSSISTVICRRLLGRRPRRRLTMRMGYRRRRLSRTRRTRARTALLLCPRLNSPRHQGLARTEPRRPRPTSTRPWSGTLLSTL